MRTFLDEEPDLEEELDEEPDLEEKLEEACWLVAQKGLSQKPSTAELAGYALYLLTDRDIKINIPLPDAVAYVSNSLNAVPPRGWKIIALQLIRLASSTPPDLLRETIVGYCSSRTAVGPGRTVELIGPRPGEEDSEAKALRNAWYAGGGVDPSTGDKTYEHLPITTFLDQEQF